jgi:hypothetical protein
MAQTAVASNKIKYLMATKAISFLNDSFKCILMATGFTYDPLTDFAKADVIADELAGGNGYTQDSKSLAGVAVTEDDVNDVVNITWSNVTWTATSGDIGPTPGMIIYDDTVSTPVVKPIVGYLNFGGDQTQAAGGTATVSNVGVQIS